MRRKLSSSAGALIDCRRVTARALACSAALLLLACSAARRSDRDLELWAMGSEGEAARRLVAEFERREPGLHVSVQQIPWSAAHEKLLTAYVGDAMPDVFQLGSTWVPEFVALGALEPLDERWPAGAREDFFPGILDADEIDGQLFGVPWYVDTRLLFYRRDLLEGAGVREAPRSWDAWRAAMARVKARAGAGTFAILLPMSEWEPLVALAMESGAGLLREGDRYGDFEAPAFREAFDFYLALFREGLAPKAGATQIANLYQDFAAGFFTFYVSGPWNLGEFARRLPAGLQAAWATAPMPSRAGEGPGVSLAGGASLAVLRGTPRTEAAWRLVEFLAEPAQQLALYRETGDLPARPSAWTDPALANDPRARAFRVQLDHVRPTPKIPEWERIADKLSRWSEAAIRGQLAPAEALARLDAEVDALLAKRRALQDSAGGAP